MKEQPLHISLLKKQIVNDVAIECNIIGRELRRNPETEEQGSNIMTPDDELTKPIVARAITEGFGEVKRICQRYLVMGREIDDNRLERINDMNKFMEKIQNDRSTFDLVANTPYIIEVEAEAEVTLVAVTGGEIATIRGAGRLEYAPIASGPISIRTQAKNVKLTFYHGKFGSLDLDLTMPPSFNLGMTETIKSCAHRMIVDHIMHTLLLNQWQEKSILYKERFNADAEGLREALRSRTRFVRMAHDWS